jgi:hypothetical protein
MVSFGIRPSRARVPSAGALEAAAAERSVSEVAAAEERVGARTARGRAPGRVYSYRRRALFLSPFSPARTGKKKSRKVESGGDGKRVIRKRRKKGYAERTGARTGPRCHCRSAVNRRGD